MEGVTFSKLVSELAERLSGARVEKVRRVGENALALKVCRQWLVISADPRRPFLLFGGKPEGDEVVSDRFTLLVQKHLRNARLRVLQSPRFERFVFLHFAAWPEESYSAEPVERTLAAVLFGGAANLYLLDENCRIIERLASRGGDANRPGETFQPPSPRQKKDPRTLSREDFLALVRAAPSLTDILAREVDGLGTLYAAEVEARWRENRGESGPLGVEAAYEAFLSVVDDLFNKPARGLIYSPVALDRLVPGEIRVSEVKLSLIPLRQCAAMVVTRFGSVVEAVASYYRLVEEVEAFHRRRATALANIVHQIEKKHALLDRLQEDLRALGDHEQWRRWGELLLASAATAVRTGTGFRVVNFYDPDQVWIDIPARATQSPQQAAESYFTRYRKAKRGRQMIEHQQAKVRAEIDRLERIRQALAAATTWRDVQMVTEQLGETPPAIPRSPARPRSPRIPGVRRFLSSDGYEILVGRSAEDNEQLTFKLAGPHDLWLHAADYPGSHVIVRKRKGEQIPARTLVEAAQVAAYFSQARGSTRVVVYYTERKFVSKIPRAAPGRVRLADVKSLVVEPQLGDVRRQDE
jgi:predicted ribosome quality control (RQC) complex YloA/Tae2 family protein